jgi:hypothetical protein
MIPYEELVIALQTWRAKQGLPVGQLSGALMPPPVVAAPRSAPPMAPPSTGRTGPQQAFLGNVSTPPPLAAAEEPLDVDESALIEEAHYENEGDDFGIAFGAKAGDDGESTSIGGPPIARASEHTIDEVEDAPASKSNRNEDW